MADRVDKFALAVIRNRLSGFLRKGLPKASEGLFSIGLGFITEKGVLHQPSRDKVEALFS